MSDIIRETAEREVREEMYREEIEREKQKVRDRINGIRWWHVFIPFKIVFKIQRR